MQGCNKNIVLLLTIFSLCCRYSSSQYFSNPSFEGNVGQSQRPPNWYGCRASSSPDIQPGYSEVDLPPKDGNTYIGMRTRGSIPDSLGGNEYSVEDAQTKLLQPLLKEYCYLVTIDLAYDSAVLHLGYPRKTYPTKLRIWGGSRYCDASEMIGESDIVNNTSWKTVAFNISPRFSDYEYLTIEPWWVGDSMYHGMMLADNIQVTEIYPAPEVKLDTTVLVGEMVTLHASESNFYKWMPRDNRLSCYDCDSPTTQVNTSKVYSVDLEYYQGCTLQERFILNIPDCDQVWEEKIWNRAGYYYSGR